MGNQLFYGFKISDNGDIILVIHDPVLGWRTPVVHEYEKAIDILNAPFHVGSFFVGTEEFKTLEEARVVAEKRVRELPGRSITIMAGVGHVVSRVVVEWT